ncbi:hypothetical protein V0M98_37310 (plasmid) [Pseudomonas silesiensis]|uniref:hypothetical protein n=1 Tax=Pseudomonas silesiensis TaxID=1853130 RepID=UPI0030CD4228
MKIHSFSHQAKLSDTDIRKCHESYIHFMAKTTISRMGYIYLPEGLGCYSVEYGVGQKSRLVTISELHSADRNVRVDVSGGDVEKYDYVNAIRPDSTLACSIGGHEFELNVEIYYTHKVGKEKRSKIKGQGLNCIEVDLSGVSTDELEASIEQRLLDTNFVKIINLNHNVIDSHFKYNSNIVNESDAMNIYIQYCIDATSNGGVNLQLYQGLDHFINRKGEKIYHEFLPENHQLYKCIGGEYGLLFFENIYGNRINISIRREANTKAHLITLGQKEMGFPDVYNIGSRNKAGPEPVDDEKFKTVSDWIVTSAFKEIDRYASVIESKLLNSGISIGNQGQCTIDIDSDKGFISVSSNFVEYYGMAEISRFLSCVDVNKISRKNNSLNGELSDDHELGVKHRKVQSLYDHINTTIQIIRKNFLDTNLYWKSDIYQRLHHIQDIISGLIHRNLYLINDSQSLSKNNNLDKSFKKQHEFQSEFQRKQAELQAGVRRKESELEAEAQRKESELQAKIKRKQSAHEKRQSELLSKYRDDSL